MKNTFLIFTLLFLLSCSVQKRRYQKGFYVSKVSHSSQDIKNERARKEPENRSHVLVPEKDNLNAQALASAENSRPAFDDLRSPSVVRLPEDSCDVLLMKDGSEVKVKISEVTESQVKYKKCAMLDGPLYVSHKSEVFMIKYFNGTREVIKYDAPPQQTPEPYKTPQKRYENAGGPDNRVIHPLAALSFVFGIIGCYPVFVFGSILGLVFGNMALKRINAQPEKYKGIGLARAGRTMGMISLIILGGLLTIFIIATLIFI